MKFPRFYNPFALIRSLKADLANVRFSLYRAQHTLYDLRQQRDEALDQAATAEEKAEIYSNAVDFLGEALDVADQAIDSFMDDRETLKALSAEQATETLEVIAFVKQAEQALADRGITLEDGETGLVVTVDQDAFVSAMRNGGFKVVPTPQAAAA